MTAERESMTLQEMGAPALGVEERRDEAPGAGASHARPTPDPEVVAADVESAAHRPDRISRPIFELSHTRCRDHARQAGPQRPDSSA